MPFRQEGERRQNLLSLVLMVYDRDGRRVEGSQKTIEPNLTESSYRTMLQRGFMAKTELEVPTGVYDFKAVVRESHRTRMGSLHKTATLPIPESTAAGLPSPADSGVAASGLLPRFCSAPAAAETDSVKRRRTAVRRAK